MMNILTVDLSTYLFIFLSFFAGNYKEIILLYLIIIIHELGHVFFLKLFHKKVIEIKIYPFGGITKYQSLLNHSLKEELLISLGGIINQLLLGIAFYYLFKINLINQYTYNIFLKNNNSLLIFNLLPIIGLDGEKILHLLLELFIPYSKANLYSIIISFISLIILLITSYQLKINTFFILFFFLYKIIYFLKNRKNLERKFILERYLYDIKYNKIKYIKNIKISDLYQETYHFFDYIPEKIKLKELFEGKS